MPLVLTGEVRGLESRTMQGPTGSFESVTIHVLDGIDMHRVRPGRDFKSVDFPKEGQRIAYEVTASAFSRRDGSTGVQLTAVRSVAAAAGARVAAAS